MCFEMAARSCASVISPFHKSIEAVNVFCLQQHALTCHGQRWVVRLFVA